MKKIQKTLALLLAMVMLLGLTACGTKEDENAWNVSYWIPKGVDSGYYAEYEENPVWQYISENYTFNGKKLKLDFLTAPPGSEAENWNNLIATGDYCGIMNMSMASATATEMYEDGMIWDLTEMIKEHAPNYVAYLDANPNLYNYVYTYVNGEAKILSLCGFSEEPGDNFQGYCYRRDWVAKYGTNPTTGAAFTYGYTDPSDVNTWYDDVVFPSGETEPIYISDWEWMFEIFVKAMDAQGIEDGYCFSPFYMGYMQTGDLYTGFGGGAPYWYYNGEEIVYGVIDDNMRAYLQCLNTWYEKGWADQAFDEHVGDMFFSQDTATVYQGKVGLWQGITSQLGDGMAVEGTLTEGIVVYGCRQPINDIYGGEEQQNKTPNHMFQSAVNSSSVVFTDKMSEDEVIAVLELINFLFSEEGALLATCGLNAEQLATIDSSFYDSLSLSNGAYTVEEVDGQTVYKHVLGTSDPAFNTVNLNYLDFRFGLTKQVNRGYTRIVEEALNAWDYYRCTAQLPRNVLNSVTAEQNQEIAKIGSSLGQFEQKTIPLLIKGEGYDVWDDGEWEAFCKDITKRKAGMITDIYNEILDTFQ